MVVRTDFGNNKDLIFNSGSATCCHVTYFLYSSVSLISEIKHAQYLAQSKVHSKLNSKRKLRRKLSVFIDNSFKEIA